MSTFEEVLREGMMSLPHDLKAILRVMEDPDLDDAGRVLVCGTILHVLSGQNAIPGTKGLLAYADDVILLRLLIERLRKSSPDVVARHCEDSADTIGMFDDQMKDVRAHLGELMTVLDRAVDGMPKTAFEGHTAVECARDEEHATWLYDSVQEAIVERLELNEDAVARAVKNAGEIRGFLRQRL
ncbi:MAG: hypothetical protein U0234_13505 [Sandaracinus sp.]